MKKSSRHRRKATIYNPEKDYRISVPKDYPWILLDRLTNDLDQCLSRDEEARVRQLIRYRDTDALFDLSKDWGLQSIDLNSNGDVRNIRAKLCIGALLKKYPFAGNASQRKLDAFQSVKDTNDLCSWFNTKGYKCLSSSDGKPSEFLQECQRFCADVLGVFDPSDLLSVTRSCRHGPGATTATSPGRNSTYFKYASWPYHVTADALPHARRLIASDERWLGALEDSYRDYFDVKRWSILDLDVFWSRVFHIVPGNKITVVPKDGRKDRPIAIEPTMNVVLQLGVDGHIRRRLKRWGINLDSQFKNQHLSYLGSIGSSSDKPCTIDLASASDTISLRIVKLMVPDPWFKYICSIRSPLGEFPNGETLRYSKVSSMGNGGTFAVESLIFAAVCYACSRYAFGRFRRDLITVFGDDIIVPESIGMHTVAMLRCCGFQINSEKSFLSGNIKESCGTDWIHGNSVRPIFLKRLPNFIDELYTHRNLLVRWFELHMGYHPDSLDEAFIGWVPKRFQLFGPLSDEEFGGYLHCPKAFGFRNCGYSFKAVTTVIARTRADSFLFRKLMHPLREITPCQWRPSVGANNGSTFDVTNPFRISRRVVDRRCSDWNTDYRPLFRTPPGEIPGGPG